MPANKTYGWSANEVPDSHKILIPAVQVALSKLGTAPASTRVLDLGCGNGQLTGYLSSLGYDVEGVEPSDDGVAAARMQFPGIRFHQLSAYDDLSHLGQFDVVIGLEVVEHLYNPELFVRTARRILSPNGILIISTPFHGYFKNVIIAATNKWDYHHTTLEPHMHIKFFSKRTLSQLLDQEGFLPIRWDMVGRIPVVAKSMVVTSTMTAQIARDQDSGVSL